MLAATNIEKTIGNARLLSEVSVELRPGEALGIVGPNGSGKSTLLRALALVDRPTKGTICIDGQQIGFDAEPGCVPPPWPTLTIVFQQLFLWPHMTLRENISLPARLRGLELQESFSVLANQLGLNGLLDRHPNEVSGGERQRAALMRALVLRPKYLLLDEVTSALDVAMTQRVLELLLQYKSEGMAIAFVSHLLGFARRLADSIVFLEDGLLLEHGPPEILTAPKTDRMRRFVSLLE